MKALEVGDRVLYEGKTWRVTRLAHHALHRDSAKTMPLDELQATLLLEVQPPGSARPVTIYLPESSWGEVVLLGE